MSLYGCAQPAADKMRDQGNEVDNGREKKTTIPTSYWLLNGKWRTNWFCSKAIAYRVKNYLMVSKVNRKINSNYASDIITWRANVSWRAG